MAYSCFFRASVFAINLSKNASWATFWFALSPRQVKRAGSWRARAKLKVTGQGNGPFRKISARLSVACSTVWPPERKTTPARDSGMCAFRISAVLAPTSAGVEGVENFLPARTILHFRMQARRLTPISESDLKRVSRILAVVEAQSSME